MNVYIGDVVRHFGILKLLADTVQMKVILVVCALVSSAGFCWAGRLASPATILDDGFTALGSQQSEMLQLMSSRDHEGHKIAVAYKYIVPPHRSCDFVKEWRKVEKQTVKEKANLVYDLKKTETDNHIFFTYGEWESLGDWHDHVKSRYVMEFIKYLGNNEIVFFTQPLLHVSSHDVYKANKQAKHNQAHVLIRYVVDPRRAEDFIREWDKVADETKKEQGNHIYSLRKTLTDNIQFWVYGTWDSKEDYEKHFKSDHVEKLKRFAAEHDIFWHLAPLKKKGDEPEK